MAAQMLAAIGVETSAAAVAEHYGARRTGGVLDAWLVDVSDADQAARVQAAGIDCRAVPLMMTDVEATAAMVREAYALVGLGAGSSAR
jgi:LPPG:FO 2-phospho-L-lactate transferase